MAITSKLPRAVYQRVPKKMPLIEQYPLYTLSFDGVNNIVTVSDSASIRFTSAFTLMASIYPISDGGGTYGRILCKNDITDYSFHMTNGTRVCLYIGGAVYGGTPLGSVPFSQWSHVVATFNKSLPTNQIKFYVNGNLTAVDTRVIDCPTSLQALTVGNRPTLNRGFDGLTTGVCEYNRDLNQAEIQYNIYNPLSPVRSGLVLFLPMIEGQGINVADYSGQGNNGTLLNGVTWSELQKYEIPAGAGL